MAAATDCATIDRVAGGQAKVVGVKDVHPNRGMCAAIAATPSGLPCTS